MNLTGTQGNSFYKRLVARDSDNNIINLSGFTASGYVRSSFGAGYTNDNVFIPGSGILLNLNPQIISGASGSLYNSGYVDINVGRTGMAVLPCSYLLFDVQVFSGTDYGRTIEAGYFIINPEVTY
jgi:hypothetical protein